MQRIAGWRTPLLANSLGFVIPHWIDEHETDAFQFKMPMPMSWNMMSYYSNFAKNPTFKHPRWIHWSCSCCGFGLYEAEINPSSPVIVNELLIPYWSIVAAMTFVSARLLFSKPRQSTQRKNSKLVQTVLIFFVLILIQTGK